MTMLDKKSNAQYCRVRFKIRSYTPANPAHRKDVIADIAIPAVEEAKFDRAHSHPNFQMG